MQKSQRMQKMQSPCYDIIMKLLLLSSSRGTTLQAVLDALKDGSLTMECLGLIADREDRGCVGKAREAGIPVRIVTKEKREDREEYDRRLHQAILDMGGTPPAEYSSTRVLETSTIIAALGWMFILSPWFVQMWHKRIVNVHPALLPKHPGGHAIEETLAAGDTESGMTIHYIDEGVDTGEILVQKKCSIGPAETEESLKEKIQTLEKEWYPKVLQMIEDGEISLM